MIKTPICDLLGIEHPIVLGGMGGGYTQSAMVAAVSNAGGLGTLGCYGRGGDQIRNDAAAIRNATNQPFALNFLLFSTHEDSFAAAIEARPAVLSYAWPRGDQEIRWCPGCGDYAIVKAVQRTLAELGADPTNTVFVSGIGCAARFPYYMEKYGFHTIHGRAPAVATGVKRLASQTGWSASASASKTRTIC